MLYRATAYDHCTSKRFSYQTIARSEEHFRILLRAIFGSGVEILAIKPTPQTPRKESPPMRAITQDDINAAIKGCQLTRKSSQELADLRVRHAYGEFKDMFASRVIVAAIDQLSTASSLHIA